MAPKVVVTGAAGYLGTSLLQKLSAQGMQVDAWVWPSLPEVCLPNVNYKNIDIRDHDYFVRHLQDVQYVLHMAAVILTRDEELLQKVNAESSIALMRACELVGVQRFVLVSSISVTYPQLTAYARSKIIAENYLQKTSLNWSIARPTLLVGKYGGAEYRIFQKITQWPWWILPQGGIAKKRPVHTDDLAVGLVQLLFGTEITWHKIYAMAGLEVYTLRQMLEAISRRPKRVMSLPVWACFGLAQLLDIVPKSWRNYNAQQALQGLLQDATPDIKAAQADFGYSPSTMLGRWIT